MVWGISAGRDFTTVCFCCPCCCIMFNTARFADEVSKGFPKKLEGVTIDIDTDKCIGCGACVEKCFIGAMSLVDRKSHIDETLCKTCGRCANICIRDVIQLNIPDVEYTVNALLNRLDDKVGGFNMPEGFKLK